MIEARDVSFSVGNKALISNVSVSFGPGELNLIIGPNGAGKSTLIKVLARLMRPQTGTVSYDGRDIGDAAEAALAKQRAVLSQAIEIPFPLTVREIVMMGRYPHFKGRPGNADEQIVDEVMDLFEVQEFTARNYQTLSGGERQRVNFARVLAQLWRSDVDPAPAGSRYLFLDEPLTFLDISHQMAFMRTVSDFARQADVVTVGVVHDLNLAARFADQIVLMNDGMIVTAGTPTEVMTAANIKQVFDVEPTFVEVERTGVHLIFD